MGLYDDRGDKSQKQDRWHQVANSRELFFQVFVEKMACETEVSIIGELASFKFLSYLGMDAPPSSKFFITSSA